MGNLCTGRRINKENMNEKPTAKIYNQNIYDTKNIFNKQEQQLRQNAAINQDELFKEVQYAKETQQVDKLVQYLNNDQAIQEQIEMEHQWVQSPKSIGSLATMYLAIIFSPEDFEDAEEEFKHHKKISKHLRTIQKNSFAQKIIINLKCHHIDRQEISILLLNYLIDNQEIHQYLLENKVYDEIIPYIGPSYNQKDDKDILGLRMAASICLRDLYKNRPFFQKQLLQAGFFDGIKDFIKSSNQAAIFEGLTAIDDIIYDETSKNNINVQIVQEIAAMGFIEVLNELITKTKDQSYIILLNEEDKQSNKQNSNYANYLKKRIQNYSIKSLQ